MGYNFNKRISSLKGQAEKDALGRWGLFRTFFLCIVALYIFSLILPKNESSQASTSNSSWEKKTASELNSKITWLEDSIFVIVPGASSLYLKIAETLDGVFETQSSGSEESFSFDSALTFLARKIVSYFLRLSFLLIAFLPFWIIAILIGYYLVKDKYINEHKTESLLGACDRGLGPFYSGIYGPLRPNDSFSGTDYSCPGLACPEMEEASKAEQSKLAKILKSYSASNDTNISLVRVILKHSDFPAIIGDETAWEEEQEDNGEVNAVKKSETGFINNKDGKVIDSALNGLSAILEARKKIGMYIDSLDKKGIKEEALEKNFAGHLNNLNKLTASSTELSRLLTFSLTPKRLWAFAKTPIEMIATSYLATEAGKALVFKRSHDGFVRISNYPHLQARAVLHSIISYSKEYNGDKRLTMRQAIICSRRHGDFARAFLPTNMPLESRAIRDCLEILYSNPEKRAESANLVELDANIDEIGNNWKTNLANFNKGHFKQEANVEFNKERGLPFKSVVLMPIKKAIELSISSFHPKRLERINELIELTRKSQARISISARLPGFKRQALEADDISEDSKNVFNKIFKGEDTTLLANKWKIVRRMLTKHNWLSTRVGDDAVPMIGIVEGSLRKSLDFGKEDKEILPGLIPLRHRRFAELFGRQWESNYFSNAPMPELIEVSTKKKEEAQVVAMGK